MCHLMLKISPCGTLCADVKAHYGQEIAWLTSLIWKETLLICHVPDDEQMCWNADKYRYRLLRQLLANHPKFLPSHCRTRGPGTWHPGETTRHCSLPVSGNHCPQHPGVVKTTSSSCHPWDGHMEWASGTIAGLPAGVESKWIGWGGPI